MTNPIPISGNISIAGLSMTGTINFSGPMVLNGVLCDVSDGHMVITPVPVEPTGLPPRNNLPIIPKMTAPTVAGFTASATSAYDGIARACNARSENPVTNLWQNLASSQGQIVLGGPEHVHTLMFDGPHAVYSSSITLRSDDAANSPRTWLREVYDGAQWIAAGSFTKNDWTPGQKLTDDLQTPGIYYGVRWRVTSSGPLCQFADTQAYS